MLGNISPNTGVKMAYKTAQVSNGVLLNDQTPNPCTQLDSPAWFAWLEALLLGQNNAEQSVRWRPILGNISPQVEVKTACKTARMSNGFLLGDQTPDPSVPLNSPAWFGWLDTLHLGKNDAEQRVRRRPMLGNISPQTEVKTACKTARMSNWFQAKHPSRLFCLVGLAERSALGKKRNRAETVVAFDVG